MGPQQWRTATRTVLLGVVGVPIMAFLMYLAFTAHSGLPFRTTTTVKAAFHDVASIHRDSQVRQNSLRIGRVDKVEYVDGQAVVTLHLDGHRQVFADARASVWDFSALGQKFIELSPGSPEAGPLGDRIIAADRNADSTDIYQLFDTFDPKTLAAATSATRELGTGAAGHGDDLQSFLGAAPRLLANTGRVSEILASDEADLPALLRGADQLAARFVGRQQNITDAVAQTDATLRGLSVDNAQPLGDTLRALPATLDSARAAFDRLNTPLNDTATFFGDFRSGAGALGRSEGDLRGVLRESPRPFEKVPSFSDDAKPAVEDLSDTVTDARPLAPRLTELFDHLAEPVRKVAPYAEDTESLWARLRNMTSENINGKYYGRTTFNVNGRSAGALTPTAIGNNPYPRPGTADQDRAGLLNLGGGR